MKPFSSLLLLAAGFLWAAWLDPRLFGALPPERWIAATNAETVFIGLALLYLWAHTAGFENPAWRKDLPLITAGVIFYGFGAVSIPFFPDAAILTVAGSALSLAGYNSLANHYPDRRLLIRLIATGMALDVLITFTSIHLFSLPLGPEDGMPLRMLRLARVACFALPILCFLGDDLWKDNVSRLARLGAGSLFLGAVLMPVALTLAALVHPALKYLLPIPAIAAFVGVILAVGRSFKQQRRLELWGWILVALSMAVGLMMGGYAFNGPMPAPPGLGGYADPARRLMRLAHTDTILLGITLIFVSRHLSGLRNRYPWMRVVTSLTSAGSLLTVGVLVARMFYSFPIAFLAAGPLIVAAGLLVESVLEREYPH